MLVRYNTEESRNKEIEELVQHIANQFNITDPLDIADVRDALLAKIDTSKPLLNYSPGPIASSGEFRANVRNAYIDLIAYFIQLRDIEAGLRSAELTSRQLFDNFELKRKHLESMMQTEDTDLVHVESFSDLVENGFMSGTTVNNGLLRIRMQDVNPSYRLQSIDTTIYPAANARDRVIHSETGTPESILDTGLGSKIWAVDVYTPRQPEMYWTKAVSGSNISEGAPYRYRGILIDIKLTLSKAIHTTYLSAKFLTPTKLIRAYIDVSAEGENSIWEPMLTNDGRFLQSDSYSRTLELFNFVSPGASSQIRLVLCVNRPLTEVPQSYILNKMRERNEVFRGIATNNVDFKDIESMPDSYLYTFGVYNIKLRNRQPVVKHGIFISDAYPTTAGATIGASIEATDSGPGQIYTAKFGLRSEMALLPKGKKLDIVERLNTDANGMLITSFPCIFPSAEGYNLQPMRYQDNVIGTIFSVTTSNGTPAINIENIKVSYRTQEYSRYAFVDNQLLNFSTSYAGDQAGLCTTLIRTLPSFWRSTPRISVYEAVPVASYYITETFFSQSMIELEHTPWIDISGTQPIILTILPTPDDDAFSSQSHPDLLVDKTNYYNRSIQPMLDSFETENKYEYFIRKNKIFLNTAQYYQLQVEYPVKTEGVRIQIDQYSVDNKSPWVDEYTLKLVVQKD